MTDRDLLIPHGLLEEARRFVASDVQPSVPAEVLVSVLLDYESYWVISYQTCAAMKGDIGQSLAGNQPFRVDLADDGPKATGFIDDVEQDLEPRREILLDTNGDITQVFGDGC